MSLPKALLCLLDTNKNFESEEEKKLREAGFATATLSWAELGSEVNAWTQLLDVLNDESICVWLIAGDIDSYTADLISKIYLLYLALNRLKPLTISFILRSDETEPAKEFSLSLPVNMNFIKVFHEKEAYAARLIAARFKAIETTVYPFYIKAHLSSLIGLWLELGPLPGETWSGFMFAVTGSVIDVLGVGAKGFIPKTSCLEYPILNIEGNINEDSFNACAAKNILTNDVSAYIRFNACPNKLIIASYPGEEEEMFAQTLSFN